MKVESKTFRVRLKVKILLGESETFVDETEKFFKWNLKVKIHRTFFD